nr:hypothetical protein [uncultured Corynebacterium sp.]
MDDDRPVMVIAYLGPDLIQVPAQVPEIAEPNFRLGELLNAGGESTLALFRQRLELPFAHGFRFTARGEPTDLVSRHLSPPAERLDQL